MAGIKVRPATWWDLPASLRQTVASVRQDYGFYPPSVQQQIMARNSLGSLARTKLHRNRLILAAVYQGQLAGQLIGVLDSDNVAIINWLFVDPALRGGGVGRALLEDFEARLRDLPVHKMMLWTEVAAEYYKKLGWIEEAVLPRHWWGQDFSVLAKYIK